jgi:hypothetical protein
VVQVEPYFPDSWIFSARPAKEIQERFEDGEDLTTLVEAVEYRSHIQDRLRWLILS